ncbi:MAG: CRTAC1 family protein [Proteobacteria bacterium]|nr:CRTAC1 family protein [Pseudomonadota bacterium]
MNRAPLWLALVAFGCVAPTPEPDPTPADGPRAWTAAPARFDPSDLLAGDDDDASDDDDDATAAPGPCPVEPVDTWFADVSSCAGVIGAVTDGLSVETTGQAWGDITGDGDLELFVTGFLEPSHLFLNRGNGTFVEFTPAPLALAGLGTTGATFVDYDNDGDPDLHVAAAFGNDTLLRNDGGDGWQDVGAESGLANPTSSVASTWADYDGDGWLDLYLVVYQCGNCPNYEPSDDARDRLFRNLGDGTFEDTSELLDPILRFGLGYAAGWFDYDDDGDPDLYVANDKGNPGPQPEGAPANRNLLWRNDGPGCGGWCFEEIGEAVGADLRVDSMGLEIADFDGDGSLDLAVSDNETAHLLSNLGGLFVETTLSVGWDIADTVVGWGLAAGDFDNDGDVDMAMADGGLPQPNVFLEQTEPGWFEVRRESSGLTEPRDSTGFAIADYDFDGRLDFAAGSRNDSFQLFRNVQPSTGRWLRVHLVGGGGVNRDAVGARAALTDDSGRVQLQEVGLGRSLGSSHDLALHFGLGEARPQSLTVRWPDGVQEVFDDLPTNEVLTINAPGAR